MRSHATGGPAWSTMRPSRPGISAPAAPAVTSIGRAAWRRSTASRLPASMRSSP